MSDRADLPSPAHSALARIEASPLGLAQERALRLILDGVSYRRAATQAGLRSTTDLRRNARIFGVLEIHNHVAAQRKAGRPPDFGPSDVPVFDSVAVWQGGSLSAGPYPGARAL